MTRPINTPAAIVLSVTIASILASAVSALVFVPAETWTHLAALPWTTILAVGVPALVGAVSAVVQAFHPAVMPQKVGGGS